MAEARTYSCSECGGPNAANARHCTFCRTPIACLRCAHCFHLNADDSEHCSGCGEVLGLLPIELPSLLSCPDCKVPLTAFDGDPGRLHDCPSCGGQFIEHGLLYNLIERRRRFADPRPPRPLNPAQRQVRYVPCPACAQVMNRRNFGGTSGVIVDYCAGHGVWFQATEFPKVLSFVASGGLAEGRRLRLGLPVPLTNNQRIETAQRIAAAMTHEPSPSVSNDGLGSSRSASPDPTSSGLMTVAAGVAESTLELLELLGNFLLDRD